MPITRNIAVSMSIMEFLIPILKDKQSGITAANPKIPIMMPLVRLLEEFVPPKNVKDVPLFLYAA